MNSQLREVLELLNLYTIPATARMFFFVLLFIAIIMQTLCLVLLWINKIEYLRRLSLAGDFVVLLYLLHAGITILMISDGDIFAGYAFTRVIGTIAIALGLIATVKYRTTEYLFFVIPIFLGVLFFGTIYYAKAFLIGNLLLIFRTVIHTHLVWINSRSRITRLSIKEAIDRLSDGVLYSNASGKTIIENLSFTRILESIGFGGIHRAENLWQRLTSLKNDESITMRMMDGNLMLRLRNSGTWLFSKQTIQWKHLKYTQLLALDITAEDIVTMEIEDANARLEIVGRQLAFAMETIEELERGREFLRMRTQIHDLLGQRLSILHQALDNSGSAADLMWLKPLLADLNTVITDTSSDSPEHEINALKASYCLIGTDIHVHGQLPENEKVAAVLINILRECATNAIRHARARNVTATFSEDDESIRLLVRNDGAPPDGDIVDGGGITGMRFRVRELGGTLEMVCLPEFCLMTNIPKRRIST